MVMVQDIGGVLWHGRPTSIREGLEGGGWPETYLRIRFGGRERYRANGTGDWNEASDPTARERLLPETRFRDA